MRHIKSLRTRIFLSVLSLAFVVLFFANSTCGCAEPPSYAEIDVTTVPTHALEKARETASGLAFQRAWKYGYLVERGHEKDEVFGYVLRGRLDWFQYRDVEVSHSEVEASEYLDPFEAR